jgi:hypothetical protein
MVTKNEILRIVSLIRENSISRLNWLESKGSGMSDLAKKIQVDYINNVLQLLTLFENWQKSPLGRIRPESPKISYPDLLLGLVHLKNREIIKSFELCEFTIKIWSKDSDGELIDIDIPIEISPLDWCKLVTDLNYIHRANRNSSEQ